MITYEPPCLPLTGGTVSGNLSVTGNTTLGDSTTDTTTCKGNLFLEQNATFDSARAVRGDVADARYGKTQIIESYQTDDYTGTTMTDDVRGGFSAGTVLTDGIWEFDADCSVVNVGGGGLKFVPAITRESGTGTLYGVLSSSFYSRKSKTILVADVNDVLVVPLSMSDQYNGSSGSGSIMTRGYYKIPTGTTCKFVLQFAQETNNATPLKIGPHLFRVRKVG